MKRRRRPPRRFFLARRPSPLRLLSGLALAVSLAGFVHFTRIVLNKQAHFGPGAEHPWDFYADGCLALACVALALLLLDRADRPRPRVWRKTAVRRGRSGYNKRT